MDFTAESYANEPVQYPALHVVDLAADAAAVTEHYRNMVINRVNDHCMRLAVFDEVYGWHYHPHSDELFVVVSGCLVIDLKDSRALHLLPWQCATVPAMTIHRTRALGRTVNLCFERLSAETVFVEEQ
jgi:mannose-6-phosphate isomerase-like protein (cupin superfamily)